MINTEDYQELPLPLFDRFGDQFSVYVEKKDDVLRVTDDKYIYNNLFDTDNDKLIEAICHKYGVTFKDGELYIVSNESNLSLHIRKLAMAMIEIDRLEEDIPDSTSERELAPVSKAIQMILRRVNEI